MTPAERSELTASIVTALRTGDHLLTDDERQWVRLAIKKEAQAFRLREAIIEKTLGGLAWFCLVGLGYMVLEFLRSKGLRL